MNKNTAIAIYLWNNKFVIKLTISINSQIITSCCKTARTLIFLGFNTSYQETQQTWKQKKKKKRENPEISLFANLLPPLFFPISISNEIS